MDYLRSVRFKTISILIFYGENMPKCSICEKNVKKVFACKRCKVEFCDDDGDKDTELCNVCFSSDSEEKQEESDINHDIQEIEQEELE
jgi:hypothetical protein